MQQTQAIRYDECLADNGTSWSELVAKHGESCKKSEPDVCGAGTQNYYFCPDGYNQELYKSCLRSIVEPCLSIYFLVSENQLPRGWLDRTKMRWERIAFYWGDWGSQPFKEALNNPPNHHDCSARSPTSWPSGRNYPCFRAARRVAPSSGRTYPAAGSKRRRDIHRFDNANSISTCAAFFAKPRYRTFM